MHGDCWDEGTGMTVTVETVASDFAPCLHRTVLGLDKCHMARTCMSVTEVLLRFQSQVLSEAPTAAGVKNIYNHDEKRS
jgi:hypothetical protein